MSEGLIVWLVQERDYDDDPGRHVGVFASRDLALLAAAAHCQTTPYVLPFDIAVWAEPVRTDVPTVAIDGEVLNEIDRTNPVEDDHSANGAHQ